MKIKRPLVERLGVPEGILDIAEEIYPEILLSIGNNDTVGMLENSSMYVKGNFNINDFNFNRILFNYKIFEGDDLEIIGMSQSTNSKLTDKYKLKTVPNDGMVELTSGKMKSREGTVVDADELVDEMIATSQKLTEELGKVKDFTKTIRTIRETKYISGRI